MMPEFLWAFARALESAAEGPELEHRRRWHSLEAVDRLERRLHLARRRAARGLHAVESR